MVSVFDEMAKSAAIRIRNTVDSMQNVRCTLTSLFESESKATGIPVAEIKKQYRKIKAGEKLPPAQV